MHAAIAEPTRAAGLARLAAFAPTMGRHYADRRNHDGGPGLRDNVSMLSPWLRHRLIDEREVLAAAIDGHGPASEKFVSEVLWRGYFKGWLEQRPSVWRAFVEERDAQLARLENNAGLATGYAEAIEGRTGIDCFDAWACELVAQGWLHNHARMWFASIWIFTLRLPWELGADFFLRHLIDGDAASNTLSWRWVAGLHTQGKAYAARAENIVRYTGGRFEAAGLNEHVEPLTETREHPREPLPAPSQAEPAGRWALVVHEDDCLIETHAIPPALAIGVVRPEARSPAGVSAAVAGFARGAVADTLVRAAELYECPVVACDPGDVIGIIADHDVMSASGAWVPQGALRDTIDDAAVAWGMRPYDAAIWPLATAGFFKVKAGAAKALAPLGIAVA